MAALSAASMRAYRALVYETPGFATFFREATPISEISSLNIGSRPASRTPLAAHRGPARHPVGVLLVAGAGDAAGLVRLRLGGRPAATSAALADLAEAWPFFASALANMEMVMAKADMRIARRYAGLVADAGAARSRSRRRSRPSSSAPVEALLAIRRRSALLDRNPELAAHIRYRRPYLEALNHLQIELIARHREGDDDPQVREGILLTMNGIATGLRNSG